MRTTALRTKTVLAALTGAGVLALGTAAAVPATGAERTLVHVASDPSGHRADSGTVLADDQMPGRLHY
ncbi:hypothetical protein J2Z21_007070 [Streptomyces griseochromogenes]|uniref:Uncharacterized protein n=1 Tax=Streptomyces griseochromogenes TaxID=68214 RepID=A0A1B1AQB6_9ACTN|nr:hypothetical protein [Streptomyces griseochromogenes]ANP48771.1 hypothetical protein AVL59_03560 [Streptomyces griseochromogenes]MBP2054068.1 hypothetical protein [Streptomyces griseochromogenes]